MENNDFETSLGYIESPCLKNNFNCMQMIPNIIETHNADNGKHLWDTSWIYLKEQGRHCALSTVLSRAWYWTHAWAERPKPMEPQSSEVTCLVNDRASTHQVSALTKFQPGFHYGSTDYTISHFKHCHCWNLDTACNFRSDAKAWIKCQNLNLQVFSGAENLEAACAVIDSSSLWYLAPPCYLPRRLCSTKSQDVKFPISSKRL